MSQVNILNQISDIWDAWKERSHGKVRSGVQLYFWRQKKLSSKCNRTKAWKSNSKVVPKSRSDKGDCADRAHPTLLSPMPRTLVMVCPFNYTGQNSEENKIHNLKLQVQMKKLAY